MSEPATGTLLSSGIRRLRSGPAYEDTAELQARGILALQAGAWMLCMLSTALAALLVARFAIAVDGASLLAALLLLSFLLSVHVIYGHWRYTPKLSHLCGALAAMSWSGAMAGIISLVGLRARAPMIDAELAGWDRAAGIDLPALVAWAADNPAWSQLLGIAYESSFPLLFGLAVMLSMTRRFERLWVLTFVFAATIIVSAVISVVWPAQGAFAHFAYPASLTAQLPGGAGIYHLQKFDYFRNDPSPLLSFANLQGVVTFPSFHCCLALMSIAAAWDWDWGWRWAAAVSLGWNALVIVSTIPIGGHYAVDLPAGALLWLAVTVAALALLRIDPATALVRRPRLQAIAETGG